MNQLAQISPGKPVDITVKATAGFAGVNNFERQLRLLAAQFKMHYGLIHRLGPADLTLSDSTYLNNLRGLSDSRWCLADLLEPETIDLLNTGLSPVIWQNSNLRKPADPLTRLNIRSGISVPFHNALGNHVALTLCDVSGQFSETEVLQLAACAVPLIEAVLRTYRQAHGYASALTAREIHCLGWAAAGKTSLETGIILGLSPHTVNQYLSKATEKLMAVNRTHAVTKAIRMGLINISAA